MNINYEGLVCYLNSNKDSKQNNVWLDSSGNNNNATLTSFSDNDFNGSYVQFNGNNYAVIPRCIQDDFTLSAEVILESSTSTAEPWQLWYNYASLIDAETSGVNNDFGLTISKDGHAYFGIGNPDRTIPYAQKSLFNEKHIITCTRKKDTGEYAMYIDGILIKKEIHPNKNSLIYPSEIYVGKGINNRFLSMKLFSIRIYNRVLDNFEIKQDSFFVKNKVYVNENNLPIIVDKLTDAKNIKIANNKYGNRVQTVINKIVEKADDVTKAIKQEVVNDSYSFKVGTGNVDVSADVEDGFGEVGVKGVTYHNLISCDRSITVEGTREWMNLQVHSSLVKPNTVYTLFFDVESISKGDSNYPPNIQAYSNNSQIITHSTNSFTFQTNSDTTFVTLRLLVNNATESTTVCKAIFKDIVLIEGNVLNNPNLPSYFEGIVGVGDKSKNLFNPKSVKFGINLNTNTGEEMNSHVYVTSDFIPVLEKTDYTVKGLPVIHYYNESKEQIAVKNTPVEGVIRTPQNCKWIRMRNYDQIPITEQKLLIKKSSFILGTYDTFEPYYEGHKIEILSSGHNLLDLLSLKCIIKKHVTKHELTSNSISFSVGTENSDPWASIMFDGFKFKENATYRVKAKCKTTDNTNAPFISLRRKDDYNNSFMDMKFTNGILNTTFLANNVGDRVEFFAGVNKGNKGGCQVDFWDVCITEELSNKDLPFQPYLKDTNSITIDSPLMRLPNGVCDEITRDGKLIRRVGKVVFTGIESWNISKTSDKTILFEVGVSNIKIDKRGDILPICDKLLASLQSNVWVNDIEGVSYTDSNSNRFRIRINKNRLDTQDLTGFKKWLSQNPTTVYYELSTPIITELPAPCLRIFKDGHLTFNTLVAPESNHVVQLNKSAQIQNAIKESQSLDNRINVLENNYDNLILFTISRLNDLEFNYTLK